MARKYHPDKNPAGRPMFLKVQMAYDRLQAGMAGGQGPQVRVRQPTSALTELGCGCGCGDGARFPLGSARA